MQRLPAVFATGFVLVLLGAAVGSAQLDVDIQKLTNGQDADLPPGPVLAVGNTVTWSYVITNSGSRPLTNINVTDDQGVSVTCPATSLDAGESMTCTASGTAVTGQYANVGTVTAERPDASIASDTDPSHYFGQAAPAVSLEKRTAGFDADASPGPALAVGAPVLWTYEVTNIGTEDLVDIAVTDDQGVVVSCPGTALIVGASMTCTASGTVQPGQYANLGTVMALLNPSGQAVAATDPSHYYGQTLQLEKSTNGQDADTTPGPNLAPGDPVTWTYVATNPGPAALSGLTVTDDQGVTVSCPQSTLAAGESVTCTAAGIAQAGQYANVGTATAILPLGGKVTGTDPSHYFGSPLHLEKSTNGQDADLPPGPSVAIGSTVSWTYLATNQGAETLTAVSVSDDQGVTVTCPATTLAPDESMTCTASGVAVTGQYSNRGEVSATSPTLGTFSASDPSHYFGQDQLLDFGDAPDPTYPTLFASNGARHLLGSGVFLGACVDAEVEGQPAAGLDGDDTATGTPTSGACAVPGDDEDGVVFTTPVAAGHIAAADIVASAFCTLSAWIDFDQDGDWGDAGEDLFPGGTALAAGINSLTFAVPAGSVLGSTVGRFRCTTQGAVTPADEASDGEVEDHAVTLVAPTVVVAARKTVALAVDPNGDGAAGAGDVLTYTMTVTNSDTVAATGVTFDDTPDANTDLVIGSVTTSQGSVTSGNTAGDTAVAVALGTLAAGGSVAITFRVEVPDPPRASFSQISNQGTVSGTNIASLTTDDPAQPGSNDPTVIAGAISVIEVPTLGAWGVLVFCLALLAVAARQLWWGMGRGTTPKASR